MERINSCLECETVGAGKGKVWSDDGVHLTT